MDSDLQDEYLTWLLADATYGMHRHVSGPSLDLVHEAIALCRRIQNEESVRTSDVVELEQRVAESAIKKIRELSGGASTETVALSVTSGILQLVMFCGDPHCATCNNDQRDDLEYSITTAAALAHRMAGGDAADLLTAGKRRAIERLTGDPDAVLGRKPEGLN